MLSIMVKLNVIDDLKNFLNETRSTEAEIDLIKGRYIIDAKSIMGLLSVDLSKPVELVIHSDDKSLLERFKKWEA